MEDGRHLTMESSMAMHPASRSREFLEVPAHGTPPWSGRLDAQRNAASAATWIAPGALERLGDARRLVEQASAELAATGECVHVNDLGWRWPGWVDVALAPSGYGITVRYGAADAENPDAPVLRPLSVPSPALERVIDSWIAARWDADRADPGAIRMRAKLVRALTQLLARHPAIRACERSALAALAIPPAVLRLARKIERCQPRAEHRQLRARSLDVAWRHFAALQRAQRESPALFALLGAYAAEHGLRAEIDPIRQLHDWCRFRGLSKVEWAELAKTGTGDVDWALRLVGDRVSRLDLVIGLARIERALGRQVSEFDGDLRISWLVNVEPWRCRLEVEHAVRMAGRTNTTPGAAAQVLGLLNHGLDAGLISSNEVLALRGWRALEARAVSAVLHRARDAAHEGAFAALDAIERIERDQTMQSWLRSLEVPATELVARRLTTAEALEAEGLDMHHCVGRYWRAVRRGLYLVYTIRGSDERAIATIGIRRPKGQPAARTGWEIDQVRGIADRPARGAARSMATWLLQACNGPDGPPEHLVAPPWIDDVPEHVENGEDDHLDDE
jgi:hypothetical protein